MNEIKNDSQKIDDWLAVQAGHSDWDKIYQDYQATTDFPGCLYYQELQSHYPDAKGILTVRDSEEWYQSVYETIFQISQVVPQLKVYPLSSIPPRYSTFYVLLEQALLAKLMGWRS